METVSTLLAEAQKETPPGLAGREDVARFFSNRDADDAIEKIRSDIDAVLSISGFRNPSIEVECW